MQTTNINYPGIKVGEQLQSIHLSHSHTHSANRIGKKIIPHKCAMATLRTLVGVQKWMNNFVQHNRYVYGMVVNQREHKAIEKQLNGNGPKPYSCDCLPLTYRLIASNDKIPRPHKPSRIHYNLTKPISSGSPPAHYVRCAHDIYYTQFIVSNCAIKSCTIRL